MKNFLILFTTLIISVSCGPNKEEVNRELILEAYKDIANYAERNNIDVNRGHNTSGYVSGDALFEFGYEGIAVNYTALQYRDREIGDLEGLYLQDKCGFSDCTDYHPISIRGRWNCRTSGDGNFNLTVSDSTVYFYIFGDGGWTHYMEFVLPSTEFVVKKLNELDEAILR